ncbi:MAG: cyclase family protein [Dehalococcoidia bacterium]|nr:cyclase family protein [Dehalococcoidia bacterium]
MTSKTRPSLNEVNGYLKSLSNWGRWGPQDEFGTLNYITPAKRLAAARLVQKGFSVGCSRAITTESAQDVAMVPLHFMMQTGTEAPEHGRGGARDFIGMVFHGQTVTHIDAFSHHFWDGKSYNGLDAKLVNARDKASKGGIQLLRDGVVTRGVLLDIARVRGVEWMGPGDGIFPGDLEAAEKAQRVRVEQGDALLYRTGWPRAREVLGPRTREHPGLDAACMPWLHQRQVAIICADSATDTSPTGYGKDIFSETPVHDVGLTAMGLWLVDNGDYETLAEVCIRENRWEFQFVMSTLRWNNATGSPVNPIAIF